MDFDFNTSHVSIKPNLRRQQHGGIYFNTSHVSIKPAQTAFCRRKSKISIHPMFLLNFGAETEIALSFMDFNTSHVSIKQKRLTLKRQDGINFNTSHVSIKRPVRTLSYSTFTDFNTSHVSIKHRRLFVQIVIYIFQYIPCFY